MSDTLYIVIVAASVALGIGLGRRRWALAVAPALWGCGVIVAGLAGGFAATGEDNSTGVFMFTALPALGWVLAAEIGVLLRRR